MSCTPLLFRAVFSRRNWTAKTPPHKGLQSRRFCQRYSPAYHPLTNTSAQMKTKGSPQHLSAPSAICIAVSAAALPASGTPMNSPTMDASPLAKFSRMPSTTATTLPSSSPMLLDHTLLHKVATSHGAGRVGKLKEGLREASGSRIGHKHLAGQSGLVAAGRRALSNLRKLHDAAARGQVYEVCELLDVFSADPDAVDEKGRSALHFACAAGSVDAAQALIERGADISLQDVNGNTCLHLAVLANQLDCVLLLLRANANASALDRHHRTPLQLVQKRLQLITDRTLSEDAGRLVVELRTLIEILSICASSSQVAGSTPQVSVIHSTLLDPDLLASRLSCIKTSEEVVDVVDDLRELIEMLQVG